MTVPGERLHLLSMGDFLVDAACRESGEQQNYKGGEVGLWNLLSHALWLCQISRVHSVSNLTPPVPRHPGATPWTRIKLVSQVCVFLSAPPPGPAWTTLPLLPSLYPYPPLSLFPSSCKPPPQTPNAHPIPQDSPVPLISSHCLVPGILTWISHCLVWLFNVYVVFSPKSQYKP